MAENYDSVFSALGIEKGAQPSEGGQQKTNNEGGAPASQGPEGFEPTFFGEEFTNWDMVKTEIPQRLSRLNELQTEVENYKSRPNVEFADPEIAEYNSFVKNTGVKDWGVFNKIKGADSNIDPVDFLVMKQVIENPDYRGKEDLLKTKVMRDYQIDPSLFTQEEIELNSIRLRDDVKKAGDWLSDLKGKMQVIAPDPEAAKAAQAKREEEWTSEINSLLAKFDKLPLMIPNGDKFESLGEFEFKEDVRKKYMEPLLNVAKGLEMNDKNRSALSGQLSTQLIVENFPSILTHALGLQRTKLEQEFEAKYGGGLERPKAPGGGSGNAEDILDQMIRANKN